MDEQSFYLNAEDAEGQQNILNVELKQREIAIADLQAENAFSVTRVDALNALTTDASKSAEEIALAAEELT
jgi:hypothetical protein